MIREQLERHGLYADPERGQHLLDDPGVVRMMVEEAELEPDSVVVEPGAGLGTITKELAATAETVFAYENDASMAAALREEVAETDNVVVREEDIMAADLPSRFDRMVGNIPFHLSAELVEMAGKHGVLSVFLVQKEFAERLVAEPGEGAYGRLTVMARYYTIPVLLETVPEDAFFPPPEVEGAVVKLYPREKKPEVGAEAFFFDVVRALFMHRRKKVRNAFYDSRHVFDLNKEEAKTVRDTLPHSEDRVVTLDLHGFSDIAAFLAEEL